MCREQKKQQAQMGRSFSLAISMINFFKVEGESDVREE